MSATEGGRLPWERDGAAQSGSATLAEIESHAAGIAASAGGLLLDLFRGPLQVEYKDRSQRDPVSEADRRAEEYLRGAILERFPDHAILGEEGKDAGPAGAEYTWVLDPLDGTTNFINGLPLFAVSVGVLRWGHPAAGAIWTPMTPTGTAGVFSARAGGGATLDGIPISVDGTGREGQKRPTQRLAGVPGGFGLMLAVKYPAGRRSGDPRTLGSIAVEAALVAAGVLQSAIFMGPKIWDVAAAVTIVREAGGSALTREGERWHELTQFQRGRDRTGALKPLRQWSLPIVVAPPPMANAIATGLHPTPLARAMRIARHPAVRQVVKVAKQMRMEFGPPRSS
jgi:myo-inositol-1(or 4)-monophosphatase